MLEIKELKIIDGSSFGMCEVDQDMPSLHMVNMPLEMFTILFLMLRMSDWKSNSQYFYRIPLEPFIMTANSFLRKGACVEDEDINLFELAGLELSSFKITVDNKPYKLIDKFFFNSDLELATLTFDKNIDVELTEAWLKVFDKKTGEELFRICRAYHQRDGRLWNSLDNNDFWFKFNAAQLRILEKRIDEREDCERHSE